MIYRALRLVRPLLVLLLVAAVPACIAAAAGAGAAAGIYATSQGVSSLSQSTVPELAARTEAAFNEMGIRETERDSDDDGSMEIEGKTDDLEITVELKPTDTGSVQVEVSARDNVAEWDKDYARRVLENIVGRG